MGVRRVVSGQDATGKAVIVSDDVLEVTVQGNMGGVSLWNADELPRFPLDGRQPPFTTLFPGAGGYRFAIMTIRPDGTNGGETPDTQAASLTRQLATVMESGKPGMHTTDTVDFEIVLAGEASMELDDDVHVHLKTGDTFVQNGTRHRWYNRGTEDAVVAVIMIGGHPRG